MTTVSVHTPIVTENRIRDYLPTLDGWRGIAVLMVICGHALMAYFSDYVSAQDLPLFARADLGVDLFFALSGLLITRLLLRDKAESAGTLLQRFWLRRLFRIVPNTYVYIVGIYICVALGVVTIDPSTIADAFLFRINLFSLVPEPDAFYLLHLWSLAIEMQFYLVWPLLLLTFGRHRVIWIAAIGLGLAAVWKFYDFRHVTWLDTAFPSAVYYWRTDIRVDAFLGGCLMAGVYDQVGRNNLQRILTPPIILLMAGAYIACVTWRPPLAASIQPLLLGAMIVGTLIYSTDPLFSWLEFPPLKWIGRVSFSLYLWQQLFLPGSDAARFLGPLQTFPLCLVVIGILSYFSYRFIEVPTARFGTGITKETAITTVA